MMRLLVISDYRDTLAVRPEAEWMIRLAQRENISIHIITYPHTKYEDRFRAAGITMDINHPRKKYDRTFIKYLRALNADQEYHIFYLFNSKAIINGIQAARKLSVKVVLYRGYTGHINWYDPTAYLKYLHPRVDLITCLAQSIKDYLHRQLFFDPSKAVTLNKGHDPKWYENVNSADLSEFGVPKHAFVVACMGNARPFKGIKYLLEATSELGDLSNLYLLLIGRDMDKGPLKKILQQSVMKDRIIPTGWRDDVLSILHAVDVFVLPSIGGEATTKSLIEAMSMGCAPIATDIAGNRGLVKHQENGLEVPIKNPKAIAAAIRKMHDNLDLVNTYSTAAKTHVAHAFHIDRTVQETIEIFNQLIKPEKLTPLIV